MECRYLPFAVSPCRVFGVDLMAHINPFKQLADWTRRSLAVGVLLVGLAAAGVIYLYQDLGKYERALPPASGTADERWGVQRGEAPLPGV